MAKGTSKIGGAGNAAALVEKQNSILQSIATGMDSNNETMFVNGLADGIMMPYGAAEREAGITPLSRSDVQASIEAFAKMHPGADETRLQEKVDDRVDILRFPTLSTDEQMDEIKKVQSKQKTAKAYVSKTKKALDGAEGGLIMAETPAMKKKEAARVAKAQERYDTAVKTLERWDAKMDAYQREYRK